MSLETDELTITSGDFLLPLNGDYSPVMTGSLIISEARIKGGVDSRGKINGTAGSELSQIINIPEPVEISGNITLNNIRVLEDFKVNDLKSNEGKSYKDIISKALPLNSSHVGVRFELRNDKVVSYDFFTMANFIIAFVHEEKFSHSSVLEQRHSTKFSLQMAPKKPCRGSRDHGTQNCNATGNNPRDFGSRESTNPKVRNKEEIQDE